MGIILFILRLIWTLFCVVLAALILVLHVKGCVDVDARGGRTYAHAKFLFIDMDLLSGGGNGLPDVFSFYDETGTGRVRILFDKVRTTLGFASRTVRYLSRHVRLEDVSLRINSNIGDAATVGLATGAAWTFIGNVMAILNGALGFNVTYGPIDVVPCFTKEMEKEEFLSFKVVFRPIYAIPAAIIFLSEYLALRKKAKKEKEITASLGTDTQETTKEETEKETEE